MKMNTRKQYQSEFFEVKTTPVIIVLGIVIITFFVCAFISDRMETQRRIDAQNALNENLNQLQASNADDCIPFSYK